MQVKVGSIWVDSPLESTDPVKLSLLAAEQGYRETRIICKEKDVIQNSKKCCG